MRRPRLPASFWTVDEYPVEMAGDWSANETANLGFDQFRGRISPRSAHALPWTVGPGSVIRGVTDDGNVLWEGQISSPITVETGEWVALEGQGYAYEAAKLADRFPLKVNAVEAWVVGNSSPLNMTQIATDQPILAYAKQAIWVTGAANEPRNNTVTLEVVAATDISIAFWAKGSRISRFTGIVTGGAVGRPHQIFAAKGPDISGTRKLLYSQTDQTHTYVDIPIPVADGFDALVIRRSGTAFSSTPAMVQIPTVWCEVTTPAIRAQDVMRGIGSHMGWDISGVQNVGEAVFPTFDWAGNAIGALSEAAGPDDGVWQVRERYGTKPRLEFRRWGDREFSVSSADGARWRLNRMERYNRVTAQYLDEVGAVKTATVDADPDPLPGQTKELVVTLGGLVPIDVTTNTADTLAQQVLDAVSVQRFRGDIDTPAAYWNGGFATYDVRAGDTVRVTDWSRLDGAFSDRIASVTKGSSGVVITLEPSTIAGGTKAASGGITPGTLVRTIVTGYLPPQSPGTTTPKTGVNPPYDPTVGDILF